MSVVPVRYETLASGDLPAVCVKTGVPTNDRLRRSFVVVACWTWILLPFGILPWLIARGFTRTRLNVVLPMSEQAYEHMRAAERFVAAALLAMITLFAAALILRSGPIAACAAAMLVAAVIGWCVATARGVGVEKDERHCDLVLLTRVNAEFARACGRREGARLGEQ